MSSGSRQKTRVCQLQSKKGSDSTDKGAGRANSQSGSGTSLGSSSSGASLGTSARASGLGAGARVGARGRRRSTGASGVRARSRSRATVVAAAAGSLGSSLARDVEVLGNAALDAVAVLLGLFGRAVTLDTLGGTLVGVNGVLVVGGRDLFYFCISATSIEDA